MPVKFLLSQAVAADALCYELIQVLQHKLFLYAL